MNRSLVLGVLLVAPFLGQADATIANVATPSIGADLGASGAVLELVIGGYLAAFAMLLIVGARLGQSHGYKRLFIAGVALFSVGSLACGIAPDPTVLVIARVLQGGAAALMFPQTLTGIQLNFSGAERARAIGMFAIALSVGAVLGQILGGVLVDADIAGLGWRAIFLVNVPIGFAAVIAAVRVLPSDSGGTGASVDVLGTATLSASVVLLVLPLSLGRTEGWPAWTWICLFVSLPLLAAFAVVERRAERAGGAPLVRLDVVVPRPVWAGLANLGLSAATYLGLLFTIAQYLQGGLGKTALASGLTLVPWVAAFGLAGQIVPRMPARVAALAPVGGSLVLTAAYAAISAVAFAGDHGQGVLLALLAIGGFGLGAQFSSMLGFVTGAVAATHAPDLSGIATTVEQIGGSLGVAGFGTLYLSNAGAGVLGATHGLGVASAAFAAVSLLATFAAQVATRSPASQRHDARDARAA